MERPKRPTGRFLAHLTSDKRAGYLVNTAAPFLDTHGSRSLIRGARSGNYGTGGVGIADDYGTSCRSRSTHVAPSMPPASSSVSGRSRISSTVLASIVG